MNPKVVKVLEQYMTTFSTPDPEFESRKLAFSRLKELGCTQFQEYKHYDITSDGIVITVIGSVVE